MHNYVEQYRWIYYGNDEDKEDRHKTVDIDFKIVYKSRLNSSTVFANKGPQSQSYGFCSSPVQMWELDHMEGWVLKNWCFWTVVLEKTLESPLDSKEIKPGNPKGDHSWVLIGRTDAETEAPILWSSDVKNRLTGKDPDAGKDWRQEKKGATEDEMAGQHHYSMDVSLSKLWEIVKNREAWYAIVHGVAKRPTWLSSWTTTVLENEETGSLRRAEEKKQTLSPFWYEHLLISVNS